MSGSLIFWEVPGRVSLRVGDKPHHLIPHCKPPERVSPQPLPPPSPENPSMPGCHQDCRGPNHIAFLLIVPRVHNQGKEKQKEHPCPCSYAVDPQESLPMPQIPQSSSVFCQGYGPHLAHFASSSFNILPIWGNAPRVRSWGSNATLPTSGDEGVGSKDSMQLSREHAKRKLPVSAGCSHRAGG